MKLLSGLEVAGKDLLHWLTNAGEKVQTNGPKAVAAAGALLEAADKALADISEDASNPAQLINIPLDLQQAKDIKAVLPDVKNLFAAFGVNL